MTILIESQWNLKGKDNRRHVKPGTDINRITVEFKELQTQLEEL